ncbi:pilus assembly protein PilP [Arhodomonas sp. AD133]|uniref:pilus assembly protein PilP n=1 Tax=Arhodomonas sp. AD133 TaxID=3415009 RepID=UPI003EC122DE
MSELRQYIAQVKQRPGGNVDPIPQMQPFESYTYPEQPLRNPFRQLSFAEPEPDTQQVASGPSPDRARPKEALEAFPLDALTYVGTIGRNGQEWGLVQAPDGTIHRVQSGNYLGQNYGRITAITPTAIELRELTPQGNGGWKERQAELALKD